jgi:hypothetical protein
MDRAPSLWRWLLPAAALHVLVLGLRGSRPEAAGGPAATPLRGDDVEIDLVGAPPPAHSGPDASGPGVRIAATATMRGRDPLRAQHLGRAGGDGEGSVLIPGDPRAPAPGESGSSDARRPSGTAEAPGLSLEQLGVGIGRAPSTLRVPTERPASRRERAARRVQRVLSQGLADHDRELGLGAHGPIIGALERAARSAATPANGRAELLATVDASGRLVSIEVLEVSEDFRAWQRAAERARRALGHQRFRVPPSAQGLALRLEIVSRVQMPSGRDPGLDVSVLGIPLQRGEGERSSKLEILNPVPRLDTVEVPNPGGGENVRLPVIQIQIVPLALAADPVDIGAHAQRVVRGSLLSVEVL